MGIRTALFLGVLACLSNVQAGVGADFLNPAPFDDLSFWLRVQQLPRVNQNSPDILNPHFQQEPEGSDGIALLPDTRLQPDAEHQRFHYNVHHRFQKLPRTFFPVKAKLFAAIQYVLPHHLISRAVHYFVECEIPWFKNALIGWAINHYDVDMSEAEEESPEAYRHFNDFFTRALKEGARPLPEEPKEPEDSEGAGMVVSPADGAISQLGDIRHGRIFQAKGHDYSLIELLGGDARLGQEFMGGKFATIYLSPRDYHRIHIPAAGKLRQMIHVPGRLFSVNQGTVENIPNLFARNERVVSIFDTDHGPMAVIMVGAINVASIETVWAGLVTPQNKRIASTHYGDASQSIELGRGDEMGRFKLGSTVIVLFGERAEKQVEWLKHWQPGMTIKMGEALAEPDTGTQN